MPKNFSKTKRVHIAIGVLVVATWPAPSKASLADELRAYDLAVRGLVRPVPHTQIGDTYSSFRELPPDFDGTPMGKECRHCGARSHSETPGAKAPVVSLERFAGGMQILGKILIRTVRGQDIFYSEEWIRDCPYYIDQDGWATIYRLNEGMSQELRMAFGLSKHIPYIIDPKSFAAWRRDYPVTLKHVVAIDQGKSSSSAQPEPTIADMKIFLGKMGKDRR